MKNADTAEGEGTTSTRPKQLTVHVFPSRVTLDLVMLPTSRSTSDLFVA